MTQEQALEQAKLIFPEDAKFIKVERERSIGYKYGFMNTYRIWNYNRPISNNSIVATSERSWEHALAIAKSGNDDCWPEEDSPIEEVSA